MLLSLGAAIQAGRALAGMPALILVAAAVPVAVVLGLLVFVDRGRRGPLPVLAAILLWGAGLAALGSAAANDSAVAWVQSGWVQGAFGEARARGVIGVLVGPVIEELVKAGVLVLVVGVWPARLRNPSDGVLCGALVGMGFAFMENVHYLLLAGLQGGRAGIAQGVYLRGVLGGANHAVFCATVGAAIGAVRGGMRRWVVLVPVAAFAAAVAQHVLWNGIASEVLTALLCNAEGAGGRCRPVPDPRGLLVTAPLVVLACVGPGLVALTLVVAHDRRRRRARDLASGCEAPSPSPVARSGGWADDGGAAPR